MVGTIIAYGVLYLTIGAILAGLAARTSQLGMARNQDLAIPVLLFWPILLLLAIFLLVADLVSGHQITGDDVAVTPGEKTDLEASKDPEDSEDPPF